MTPLLPRFAALRFGSIGLVLILLLCGSAVWSQSDDAVDLDAEAAKQAAIAQRFATILEKNPRRGTAFDRVYGFHVEFGSLDKYVAELRERAGEEGNKGAASMILRLKHIAARMPTLSMPFVRQKQSAPTILFRLITWDNLCC